MSQNSNKIIITAHEKTYNVTEFVNKHPAGPKCIINSNGKDCTIAYDYHSNQSRKSWEKYRIDSNSDSYCSIM